MWYNIFKYKKRIGVSMEIVIDIVFRTAIYVIGFYVGVRHEKNNR